MPKAFEKRSEATKEKRGKKRNRQRRTKRLNGLLANEQPDQRKAVHKKEPTEEQEENHVPFSLAVLFINAFLDKHPLFFVLMPEEQPNITQHKKNRGYVSVDWIFIEQ
tara:strand:- start:2025 stop:2348 length:324 start_codon:yes stop_codon:yes gene_type:complete